MAEKQLLDTAAQTPKMCCVGGHSTPKLFAILCAAAGSLRTANTTAIGDACMQISPNDTSLAQQLNVQNRQNPPLGDNQAREIIEQTQTARTRTESAISGNQLALYKRPRPDLVIPQLDNSNSMGTMTRRFESLYDQQVEKGRKIDIRV